jgi:hypothetical protein
MLDVVKATYFSIASVSLQKNGLPVLFVSLNYRNGAKMEHWVVLLLDAHRLYRFPPYHNRRFCVFCIRWGFPELVV